MVPTGLQNRIIGAVAYIDSGRKGLATDGEEHEGRISYEMGISAALFVFKEAQTTGDPQIFILVEMTFLQQELYFCAETDTITQSSLTQAIQSFEDAYTGSSAAQKRIGFLKDQIAVPDDFDRMGQDEIAALFEGKSGRGNPDYLR
jgi:hypothetical protein